jgi:hypothetical protein
VVSSGGFCRLITICKTGGEFFEGGCVFRRFSQRVCPFFGASMLCLLETPIGQKNGEPMR